MAKKTLKETKEKKAETKETKAIPAIRPHITEKATFLNEKGAYVFKVKDSFNKIMIKEAVKKQYNVTPEKVSIINTPDKSIFLRRRSGIKYGYKKAIVYLKKGDKINMA
ncbi:50S ribosomal protein L23 [Candidatus Parcubacteria bacterium]|nr:MAG: 50S ribosomal protein L23 [Candidatus Parcubacteria bacterium]